MKQAGEILRRTAFFTLDRMRGGKMKRLLPKQPPLKVKSGYLVKYCKTVSSAASGAVTTSYAEGAFDR